jgi:hypothetical protein
MTLSAWSHAICDRCWTLWRPNQPAPIRVTSGPTETCCACKEPTASGIYIRSNPGQMPCKGQHGSSQ